MSAERRDFVMNDLRIHIQFKLRQRGPERVGIRERTQDTATEVEKCADVAGLDLSRKHRARPVADNALHVRPNVRSRRESTLHDRQLECLELD